MATREYIRRRRANAGGIQNNESAARRLMNLVQSGSYFQLTFEEGFHFH